MWNQEVSFAADLMLDIDEYRYDLPQERIALHPLPVRDDSKLLVYRSGDLSHARFKDIADFLPENSFLFFNDTKVIPARLHFKKATGADIEIFLLSPEKPSTLVAQAMATTGFCQWVCAIGNLKRWNEGLVLKKDVGEATLEAALADRSRSIVEFRWTSPQSFAAIVDQAGETPLPPYLQRKSEDADRVRYQTIYSRHEGAVAAPTAGLHFTPAVFEALKQKGIGSHFLTLHVSAGTFQPVKTQNAEEHRMHPEQLTVTTALIDHLLREGTRFIAVGTTSMRALESLYWYGNKLLRDPAADFIIAQDEPYKPSADAPLRDALGAVKRRLQQHGGQLAGETSIFIRPGYRFRICSGLITNFHQPASTLMILVAAFVGDDWRKVYQEALSSNYRFLSYGDSSLLLP